MTSLQAEPLAIRMDEVSLTIRADI